MVEAKSPLVARLLILKADRLYAQALGEIARAAFPGVVISLARNLAEARKYFSRARCELLIADVTLPDGQIFDLVEKCPGASPAACRLLVLTVPAERSTARRLRELRVAGIFDAASEDPEDFPFALHNVSLGLPCLSEAVARELNFGRNRPALARLAASGSVAALVR